MSTFFKEDSTRSAPTSAPPRRLAAVHNKQCCNCTNYIYLKSVHQVPCKIEVSLPRTKKSDLIFPPSIVNGIAVSKTFQILYRNEEVQLDDVIHYRVHIVLDSAKIEETLRAAEFSLEVGSVF